MNPQYFTTPAKFHDWLKKNHAKSTELLMGFYKVNSGKPSLTYQEALDEALCFGWIDGIRKSIDEERYTIRFTPRKPSSNWSNVNIKRVNQLIAEGRMLPAGLAAFEARKAKKSGVYTYENRPQQLSAEYEKKFRSNKKAWEYFQVQAAYYQRTAYGWVMTAKKEETRLRRLATLIEDSAQGRWIAVMQVSRQK
ncbi:MAG TPA: YdeI/OmpD-associated family protein [Anaerolineae bacterium]|nr:YdeI/OmpD-associated family protein [Anaerolineae bacterium]